MEDTLWVSVNLIVRVEIGLNPCFNGRYSLRVNQKLFGMNNDIVLILVLMEDTLWGVA